MSKAEELYQTFYNLIEHKLNEKYSKYEKDVVNELVNIAEKFVDEQNKTIEKTSYLMGFVDGKSQNKMPSDEEIEKTIRETLVIINKESVKYAIDKIKKLYKN